MLDDDFGIIMKNDRVGYDNQCNGLFAKCTAMLEVPLHPPLIQRSYPVNLRLYTMVTSAD